MDFDMNWVGAPTADALKTHRHIQVALDKGQITGQAGRRAEGSAWPAWRLGPGGWPSISAT